MKSRQTTGRDTTATAEPPEGTATCSSLKTLAKHYDRKINALYAQIRQLRESRNADCSATGKLPPEVLSIIFLTLQVADQHKKPRRSLTWISVTHVCRKWRAVALNESKMWTNTVGLPEKWLQLTLERAKMAPLRVKVQYAVETEYLSDSASETSSEPFLSLSSYPRHRVNPVLDKLLDLPERLGELHLIGCTPQVIKRLNRSAPFLSVLDVRARVSLSPEFLGNHAPRLLSFTLRSGSISSGVTWLRNLRTVCLDGDWGINNSAGKRSPTSTHSLLLFLGALEKIEYLSVTFLTGTQTTQHEYTGALVQLPSLRQAKFHFTQSTAHLLDLFDHIQWPASIHHLDIKYPFDFSDSMHTTKLATSFVRDTGVPFRRMMWNPSRLFDNYQVGLSAGRDRGPFLVFDNLSLVTHEPPLRNSSTIEEIELRGTSQLLSKLLEATSLDYPSLKQLIFDSSTFNTQAVVMPPLKRWLKQRKRPHDIERIDIVGRMDLTVKDMESLSTLVKVTWAPVVESDLMSDSSSD